MKLFQNLTSGFKEEEFWSISLKSTQCKKHPPHGGHIFGRIKISQTSFEKGHSRNNPVKLFQYLTSGFRREEFWRISLKSTQWKKPSPPPPGSHVLQRIKISRTIFEKEQSCEMIPQEFLHVRIVQNDSPMAAMFFHGSKFCEQFLKRVTKGIILWNYFKIWHAVSEEKNFEEFLWSPHNEKSPQAPTPMAAMFFHGSKFRNLFLKRVTQGTILWNYFKIGSAVSEEKIFKEFLKKFDLVAKVFDGIKFCTQFLKGTTQRTFLPS